MLDKDDGMTCLPEYSKELVGGECTLDIEVLGLPIDPREDPGIVPPYVEEKEPLEIRVVVDGTDHHFLWYNNGVEGTRLERQTLAELNLHSTGSLMH
jgi:hypothetical protein